MLRGKESALVLRRELLAGVERHPEVGGVGIGHHLGMHGVGRQRILVDEKTIVASRPWTFPLIGNLQLTYLSCDCLFVFTVSEMVDTS